MIGGAQWWQPLCLETQADRITGQEAAQSVMSFMGRVANHILWSTEAPKPDLPPAVQPHGLTFNVPSLWLVFQPQTAKFPWSPQPSSFTFVLKRPLLTKAFSGHSLPRDSI